MSRDIVFNESESWYALGVAPSQPVAFDQVDIDSVEDDQLRPTPDDSPISTRLSGPEEHYEQSKHITTKSQIGQREGQNARI